MTPPLNRKIAAYLFEEFTNMIYVSFANRQSETNLKKSDEETKSRLVLLKLLATALSTAPITSLLTSQALMKELKRP